MQLSAVQPRRFQSRRHWIEARQTKTSERSVKSREIKQRPNFKTFFGENGKPHQISFYEQNADDGGGIRFSSPYVAQKDPSIDATSLPIMFFLPGFDGTGATVMKQFPSLVNAFDFMLASCPLDDQTSFDGLVEQAEDFIKQYIHQSGNGRPVYLAGESFGALATLMIAYRCPDLIDRVVVINPATAYEDSLWPLLGPLISLIPSELYPGVAFAIAPMLGNPLSLIARKLDFSKSIDFQTNAIFSGIVEIFGTLGMIGDIFTPEIIGQKLKVIRRGVQLINPILSKIQQRTLVIACDGDWMLPSRQEKDRLSQVMRRCLVRSMGLRSHALLLEAGVDLVEIIKEEGFYVTERKFSAPGNQHKINSFGTSKPIEMPTEKERQRAAELATPIHKAVSPVFYSTTEADKIVLGFDGIPNDGPVLFVGNHQLIGQDTFTLVDALLSHKQLLLRGLAHPLISKVKDIANGDDNRPNNLVFLPVSRRFIQNLFTTFGAVTVSPKNLYQLLKQGEKVLLYPGGAREAFKLKGEKYQLFWPETPEFIRMASKFEATIVTVAAVGLEDWLDIVLDREDMLKTPILKEIVKNQMESSLEARPGVSADSGDFFLTPMVAPKVPRRHYFLFGKPFQTKIEYSRDKVKCQKLYDEVKTQLEKNIRYLQEKSKEDPYGDFIKRVLYESRIPGRQAPSFTP